MTDWTTPHTFAVGEVVIEDHFNTDLRDNMLHLKEQFAAVLCAGTNYDPAGPGYWSTTETSPTAIAGTATAITLTATSDVVVHASLTITTSNSSYPGWFRLYRDTTGIGSPVVSYEDSWNHIVLVAHDNNVAAGTYSYKIYSYAAGGGGQTIRAAKLVVAVHAMPVPS